MLNESRSDAEGLASHIFLGLRCYFPHRGKARVVGIEFRIWMRMDGGRVGATSLGAVIGVLCMCLMCALRHVLEVSQEGFTCVLLEDVCSGDRDVFDSRSGKGSIHVGY